MKNIGKYLLLHFALIIYSLSNVVSKYATMEPLLSFKFVLYMGLLVLCLGVYAILWQQVLKHMDLTIAYVNKGITVIWGLLISYYLFHDVITIQNIVGCVLVLIGVLIMSFGDAKHE